MKYDFNHKDSFKDDEIIYNSPIDDGYAQYNGGQNQSEGRQGMERNRAARKRSGFFSFIVTIVLAVAVGLFLRTFVISFVDVIGSSMLPTLHTGNKVLMEMVSTRFSAPNRHDIVVCYYENHPDRYIKRVIGLPGETVEIRDSVVYIDGVRLHEPFLSEEAYPMNDFGPELVKEGYLLVMGDNRRFSLDSTSEGVGQIPLKDVMGRAVLKIWPIDEFGGI